MSPNYDADGEKVDVEDRCEFCRESRDTGKGTIMKRGSGGHINVCTDCRERLQSPRCRVCGERVGRDNPPFIYFTPNTGEEPNTLEICSRCRSNVLDGNGVTFR